MVTAATSFMSTGDPNFEGNHRWPRYEAGSRHLASLGRFSSIAFTGISA